MFFAIQVIVVGETCSLLFKSYQLQKPVLCYSAIQVIVMVKHALCYSSHSSWRNMFSAIQVVAVGETGSLLSKLQQQEKHVLCYSAIQVIMVKTCSLLSNSQQQQKHVLCYPSRNSGRNTFSAIQVIVVVVIVVVVVQWQLWQQQQYQYQQQQQWQQQQQQQQQQQKQKHILCYPNHNSSSSSLFCYPSCSSGRNMFSAIQFIVVVLVVVVVVVVAYSLPFCYPSSSSGKMHIVVRNQVHESLIKMYFFQDVYLHILDLSQPRSVAIFAKDFETSGKRLHVLVRFDTNL